MRAVPGQGAEALGAAHPVAVYPRGGGPQTRGGAARGGGGRRFPEGGGQQQLLLLLLLYVPPLVAGGADVGAPAAQGPGGAPLAADAPGTSGRHP